MPKKESLLLFIQLLQLSDEYGRAIKALRFESSDVPAHAILSAITTDSEIQIQAGGDVEASHNASNQEKSLYVAGSALSRDSPPILSKQNSIIQNSSIRPEQDSLISPQETLDAQKLPPKDILLCRIFSWAKDCLCDPVALCLIYQGLFPHLRVSFAYESLSTDMYRGEVLRLVCQWREDVFT